RSGTSPKGHGWLQEPPGVRFGTSLMRMSDQRHSEATLPAFCICGPRRSRIRVREMQVRTNGGQLMAAIATTKQGVVEGEEAGGLAIFRGIPYAAPPVGALRWLAPQPPEPWSGV